MEDDTSSSGEIPPSTPNNDGETVKFSKVATVAERWMLDFCFVAACRYFKEGKLKKFNQTISTLDAITESVSRVANDLSLKRTIAGFLTRIMHGKLLDVSFDVDKCLTPLMSAINIWSSLKETVADESVFETISNLLYVQCVAVCLEKGNSIKATQVLDWLEEKCEIPKNMRIKLSCIVKKRDIYHPFLLNFSFVSLLESIQAFLETFLGQNPSDFLLMAASNVARSCPDQYEDSETEEDQAPSDSFTSESTPISKENKMTTVLARPKKKLLSTNVLLWKPESAKKPVICLNRIGNTEGAKPAAHGASSTTLNDTAALKPTAKQRLKRKAWQYDEDRQLKAGVSRHGEGKWSRIMLDYDFPGRTSVMLKDRWRVLKKSLKV